MWVLVNHFKSQSGGGGPKRARQAQGVRTIAEELAAAGERHIVVMGDLNEGPDGPGPAGRQPGHPPRPQRTPGRGLCPPNL
jgi:endonuclease/exonuclease/phosphatase family metal-dependent hydrolase